jgi:hypothetical protein
MKTNLTPSEQFKILWRFFARNGAEVEARSEELLPEQKAALAHFASGKANGGAREQLISLLIRNRNALSFLGEQIKLQRPGAVPGLSQAQSRASRPKNLDHQNP